jgi:hypothetical protein
LTQVALLIDDLMPTFKADLDAKFNSMLSGSVDLPVLQTFLNDLIGIFRCPSVRQKLFDFIFPAKFAMFNDAIENILRHGDLINPLLKSWYLWIESSKSPPPFVSGGNSADGIIMFKLTAHVLTATFGYLTTPETDNAYSRLKTICASWLILAEISRAKYVMFGAFKMYGDGVLTALLGSFIQLIAMIDLPELFDHTKVGRALMEVMRSFTECHAGLILKEFPEFFDHMIEILRRGYGHFDGPTVQAAVEGSKNLGEFFLNNKHKDLVGKAMVRNGDVLMGLFCAAVHSLCNSKEPLYPTFAFLRSIILLNPPALQIIFEILRPQIGEPFVPEFVAIFEEIERSAGCPDEAVLTKVLSTFRQFAGGKDLTLLTQTIFLVMY